LIRSRTDDRNLRLFIVLCRLGAISDDKIEDSGADGTRITTLFDNTWIACAVQPASSLENRSPFL